MNMDPTSSASQQLRKERGAIAAQACDTCRQRKQRCDEQRPCSLCQRLEIPCNYREPQPTKKDKTLTEILDRLKSLEMKVDRLYSRQQPGPGFGPPQMAPASQPSFSTTDNDDPTPYSGSSQLSSQINLRNNAYRHSTAAHKFLYWPAIQQLLLQASPSNAGDLKNFQSEGSAFIVRIQQGKSGLSLDEGLSDRPFVGMQSQASRVAGGARITFPALTHDIMQQLAAAYFDTFNFLYPFMDRQSFLSDILTKVYSEGFDGDRESVIALLVFALGELALEGSRGSPIDSHNGRPSGIRGGAPNRPPGLGLFNEARKRIGFVLTDGDLENVQIYSLAALYNQCCSRHVDFWRLTASASSACQVLITCNTIDWNSPHGDLIKRAYWHCAIMETGLHLELDLPLTGLLSLQERVGLPTFNAPFCDADYRGNAQSHWEKHYASQLALRRICADIHSNINDLTSGSNSSADTITHSTEEPFGIPSANHLRQLASHLTQWRGLLPRELQWAEDEPTSFPSPIPYFNFPSGIQTPQLDPSLHSPIPIPLFSADIDTEPVLYPYVYDIQVALLRTRYYYAKYMVYRPFVYKALHFPEQMTEEDAKSAAECLKSCLDWPLLLSPPSKRKRLIPYLFCWSQNFLGILLIIHLTKHNTMLKEICENFCGERWEMGVGETVELMLDWIRDLKAGRDPVAEWCWGILDGIYW